VAASHATESGRLSGAVGEASIVTAEPDDPGQSPLESLVFRSPRVGDLTPGWRAFTIATWVAVFFAFAAVWKASEEIGIGTWWLGSRSQPTLVLIRLIPFALAVTIALLATYNVGRLPWVSAAGAVAVAVIGIFDFQWSVGIASVELGIAGGALLVALGSLSGRYRRPPPTSEEVAAG